jgi:hypothetical protein
MEENQPQELINQLITLYQLKEDLWKYHPANKNKNDIIKDYFKIEQEISLIEETLNQD